MSKKTARVDSCFFLLTTKELILKLTLKQLSLAIASAGMLTLSGCGGGSSDSATETPIAPTTPVTPTTPTTPTTPVVTEATVSLPAALSSRPQASSCAALRTGNYLFATPDGSGKLDNLFNNFYINAETLKIGVEGVNPENSTLVPVPNDSCNFTVTGGALSNIVNLVVSQAGVVAIRFSEGGGSFGMGVGVPQLPATPADLAGTYSAIALDNFNGVKVGTTPTYTLNTSGTLTAATQCYNTTSWAVTDANCKVQTGPFVSFRANGNNGFSMIEDDSGAVAGAAAFYKAGNGDAMIMFIETGGGLTFLTQQRASTLPIAGTNMPIWNLSLDGNYGSIPLGNFINSIISVDAAAGSYIQTNQTVGLNDGQPQTVFINNPRNGYNYRPTALSSDGTTVREATALSLRGMGLNVAIFHSVKRLSFSIAKP